MAQSAWRQREALLNATKVHAIAEGVALARQAVAAGETPVVLADHSDRSGSATFLLREIIAQDLSNTLIATHHRCQGDGAGSKRRARRPAMPSTWRSADWSMNSPAQPVRIQGTILNAVEGHGQFWVAIDSAATMC